MNYQDTFVNNIPDYLSWVKNTKTPFGDKNEEKSFSMKMDQVFYRGQACSLWELKPSVFRDSNYFIENSLLKKATRRLWNVVSSFNTYLEKMIFFQHYGLCTRLVDLTSNPLVALYMACCDEIKPCCDGAVYFSYGSEINDKVAELTAKYVFEHEYQSSDIEFEKFASKEGVKVESFKTPILIQPPINNPRIEAQNGAFVMAPLVGNYSNNIAYMNIEGLDEMQFFDSRRAIIPSDNKLSILKDLSDLGFDSGTIYKDISEKIKAIVNEEKWKENIKIAK